MGFSILCKFCGVAALFASFAVAQLGGSLSYDGEETLQILIENSSESNLTFPGTNNLFDRQNLMAYAPITLTNLTGSPITLNGTRYAAPQLSDDVFQDIPAGGSYIRNLNVSQYLLNGTSQGPTLTVASQCFIASLPPSVYGLNVTGITSGETIATYYLSKGLQTITIKSQPFHFNYSVPTSFTNDQKAAIADDANVRRLENRPAGSGASAIQTRTRARRRS